MKNLLRKLHIGASQEDFPDGSRGSSERGSASNFRNRLLVSDASSSSSTGDQKPLSGLSGWLNVARNTLHPSSGSQGGSPKHSTDDDSVSESKKEEDEASISKTEIPIDSGQSKDNPPPAVAEPVEVHNAQALSLEDEEYQVQLAMRLSANDNPTLRNATAEVVAYRYWNYNALDYDEKIVDGLYNVYGVVSDLSLETMPALIDLQETPVSDNMTWEVVLVNRATDLALVKIEQKAISIALSSRVGTVGLQNSGLIQQIADLVADHMGGPVADADLLLKRWITNSTELRSSLGNVVLPLGQLQVGLAWHRALLFKVLADTIGIPCRLVKGRHYIGSDEGAMNIIKLDDGREFIVDLMGAPGTLIPSHVTAVGSMGSNVNLNEEAVVTSMAGPSEAPTDEDRKHSFGDLRILMDSKEDISGGLVVGGGLGLQEGTPVDIQSQKVEHVERRQSEPTELQKASNIPDRHSGNRSGHSISHWRSPSWTEGIGSPAVRDMKVKDVSQYMMDVAKENPKLAQKLHDVLRESGVRAPPDLFSEMSPKQLQAQVIEERKSLEEKEGNKEGKGNAVRRKEKNSVGPGRPPAPGTSSSSSLDEGIKERLQRLNSVEGLGDRRPLEPSLDIPASSSPSSSVTSSVVVPEPSSPVLPGVAVLSVVQDSLPPEIIKRVPVAAAAAATAAVVASSMVVAAAKNPEHAPDPTLDVPVAAAATATAAVVVATSAVVGRRLEALPDARSEDVTENVAPDNLQNVEETEAHEKSPSDSVPEGMGDGEGTGGEFNAEEDRVSDKSSGSISARSDPVLDDVAEWEIPWEDIVIGERIGLGSYGEVYRGEWHGTDVAVKKFLDQDISGDALEEFRSEVRLMRRMRHPNVVLFMGAVMRSPNLSIVTEFLPRGSLYRLIHRPSNQLDERRRMRMAVDVARGMNYLHSSTPVIVHRDLKSPNLLVDKNWVVKVCDFGLSRMKHNTFLSSKSTAGTPEWMAPEVLRNEPSNEKADVYSFGVILWELATLQQPWGGMNPMQVVGAVGFQRRCLDIPEDMDPVVAKIIRQCWQSDPSARPSFADILATLKPLQKPPTPIRVSESSKPGNLVKKSQSQLEASSAPISDDVA